MKLKVKPEDFKVIELASSPPLSENGEYTYFWLIKRNWTTVRALTQIAKQCRTSKKRFNFAGNKDKFAITKQICCAWRVPPEILRQVRLKEIQIDVIGRGDEKINLGMLEGNRFEITVHDVGKVPAPLNAFPNYFDDQRFGMNKNSYLIGKYILKGELDKAVEVMLSTKSKDWAKLLLEAQKNAGLEKSVLNWLIRSTNDYAGAMRTLHKKVRMLYVHSYQSLLFNLGLSALIKSKKTIEIGGKKLKVSDKVIKKELAIPGYETRLGNNIYSKTIKAQLKKDGITLEDFRCKRMPELASEGNTRPAFAEVENLKISELKNKSLTISFDLLKGAYATLFLKCLFPGNKA